MPARTPSQPGRADAAGWRGRRSLARSGPEGYGRTERLHLGRVAEAWPSYHHAWYAQAVACLATGDFACYRKARAGIIANFRDAKDARWIGHVCHVSVDLPATMEEAR